MTITVEGTLVRDARYGRWGADEACITLRATVGPNCMPFEVHAMQGKSPSDHIAAERLARNMLTGMSFRGVCGRLDVTADHGEMRYTMRDVSQVSVAGAPIV